MVGECVPNARCNGSQAAVLFSTIRLSSEEQNELLHVANVRIGRGAFADVFLAKNWRIIGGPVAVKCMHSNDSHDIEILRQLKKHPSILRMYAYSSSPHVMAVLEYCENGSLARVLQLKNAKPEFAYRLVNAFSWALQIVYGLKFMHEQGIIHRDLKLDNIMVKNNYRDIRIGDFGTSRNVQTMMTNYLGTPLTMAPEVMIGTEYDTTSDVYSFAIVFWQVLTRREPFEGVQNHFQLMHAVALCNTRPQRVKASLNDGMDDTLGNLLNALLDRCWHPVPQMRPKVTSIARILEFLLRNLQVIERQGQAAAVEPSGGDLWLDNALTYVYTEQGPVRSYLHHWSNFYRANRVPPYLWPARACMEHLGSLRCLHDHNMAVFRLICLKKGRKQARHREASAN